MSRLLLIFLCVCLAAPAWSQTSQAPVIPPACVETMPGMQMCPTPAKPQPADTPGMEMKPAAGEGMDHMYPHTFLQEIQHHASSGTSAEPNTTPAPMWMGMKDGWSLMFHANVFITDLQQTGPRAADKLFSTNWFMPMAQRRVGRGQLTLRAMVSLEPATISARQYPLLFQQGETAFARPIVDGQHPHDFFMELAALYDLRLSERTILSFYLAPTGDPAIGPTAYPHRQSASEDPVAALGHHQQDSTHIAADVVTVGLTHGIARLEASGFHGREPDEFRWNIDSGPIDSWSTRLTLQPGQRWSGQVSYARIASPEVTDPQQDQARTTASVMYNRPLAHGNWSSTAVWGRTRSLAANAKENSYLLESLLRFHQANAVWTRIEDAGRSSELAIGPGSPQPQGPERPIGHVMAYTAGYDHDFKLIPRCSTAFGAQITTYGVPAVLEPAYSSHPLGAAIFVRLRPVSKNAP